MKKSMVKNMKMMMKMNKEELLNELQDCFEAQLELKERELQILSELAELDPSFKILHKWLSNDLNNIYKENSNEN